MIFSIFFIEDDFDVSDIVAVFSPGEIETSVFISITNDLVLEQDELFDVTLTNITDNPGGINVGMPRVSEVSIVNSNSKCLCSRWLNGNASKIHIFHFIVLTVIFSQQQYSVNESDGQITVGLELSRPAGRSLTIGIRPIPNSAQGNHYSNYTLKLLLYL